MLDIIHNLINLIDISNSQDVVQPSKNLASIVAQRMAAMEKLQTKPNDPTALSELYEAQKQISVWAESKNKPGQFTGTTGAKILSKGELTLGVQAWAKQSQFTDAPKVSGGFGEYILRKMGWKEGEGLGKDRSGEVDPLTLDIKQDMKGSLSIGIITGFPLADFFKIYLKRKNSVNQSFIFYQA